MNHIINITSGKYTNAATYSKQILTPILNVSLSHYQVPE